MCVRACVRALVHLCTCASSALVHLAYLLWDVKRFDCLALVKSVHNLVRTHVEIVFKVKVKSPIEVSIEALLGMGMGGWGVERKTERERSSLL